MVEQPIDEFNRPAEGRYGAGRRVPPRTDEVETLFAGWRDGLPDARKYLPAARDYLAASLWRRVGLRISETVMLDIGDWHPDLGEHGKLHVRFGKGSRGRGPKTRLVPAINSVEPLIEWWLDDVRHQFDDDWDDPDAPLLPSERRDPVYRAAAAGSGPRRCGPGWLVEVTRWLPAWSGGSPRTACATSAPRRSTSAAWTSRPSRSCWATNGCPPRPATSTSTTTTSSGPGRRPTSGSRPALSRSGGDPMRWNLRMKAAEAGIWKSTEMRRRLADAGLEISAGKMSALWTGTPTTDPPRRPRRHLLGARVHPERRVDHRARSGGCSQTGQEGGRRSCRRQAFHATGKAPLAASCVTVPKMCEGCGMKPQAYHSRRLCYDCKPGTGGRPLPCRRCGSKYDFYTAGLCTRCHQWAPQRPEGCRDCDAWGVVRTTKWLCGGCTAWRWVNPTVRTCVGCRRDRPVNRHRACRLCWRQAKLVRQEGQPLDVERATRDGQQLFFANMHSFKHRVHPSVLAPPPVPMVPASREVEPSSSTSSPCNRFR